MGTYMVVVKHAGVVIDICLTENPDVFAATEGKRIREQFPSARFEYLRPEASEPEAPNANPPKKGTKNAREV